MLFLIHQTCEPIFHWSNLILGKKGFSLFYKEKIFNYVIKYLIIKFYLLVT